MFLKEKKVDSLERTINDFLNIGLEMFENNKTNLLEKRSND